MGKVLLLCVVAVFGVMILMLVIAYRLELLRNECAELRFEIESRSADTQSYGGPGSAPSSANEPALPKAGR